MNKSLFTLFFFIILSVFFIKSAYADNSILIGTVSNESTHVYTKPKQDSVILTKLNKKEEYPVVNETENSAAPITHTVISGETLLKIARIYDVSTADLQQVNKLIGSRLYIGQQLNIPQTFITYTINHGDTLWEIAHNYGVTMESLIKLNSLEAFVLENGKEIQIPNGYYEIQLLNNQKGWIKKSQVRTKRLTRFNLGWSYNGTSETYIQQNHIAGLDVVSPRWYTLSQTDSLVNVSVNKDYADAAAKAGKQVWPLFGNKFDPELTNDILSSQKNRQKVIRTLKHSLIRTKSQGVNIDFENIDPKNKRDYVTFIKELKNALHSSGIIVSVDVSRENADPFWSGSLDRRSLGEAADFIIMMGYDEHWASSQQSGSVASIPWTREGVRLLLKEVPAHKIILGVPFYTREWITDDAGKVRSIDRTIIETEQILQQKSLSKTWDSHTAQNYVEFTENGEKHQIWIEDETSMQQRYNLVKEFNLRGTAAWYVGGAPADIWNLLK